MTIWWEFLLQDYKINNASLHCIVYRRKPLPNCNYKSFKENESWLWKQVMQMMFLFDFVESNHKSAVDSRLELGTEILIVKKTQKTFPTAFRREEGNWQPSSSYSFQRCKIPTGCNFKNSNTLRIQDSFWDSVPNNRFTSLLIRRYYMTISVPLYLCVLPKHTGWQKMRSSMEVVPASTLLMSFLVNFVKLNFDKV